MAKINITDLDTVFSFESWIKKNTDVQSECPPHILNLVIDNLSEQIKNLKIPDYKKGYVATFLQNLESLKQKIEVTKK